MNNTYMRQLESMMAEMAISVGIKGTCVQVSRSPWLVYEDVIECRFWHHQIQVVCTYTCTGHLESDAKGILSSCLLKVVEYYTYAIQRLQALSPGNEESSMKEVSR